MSLTTATVLHMPIPFPVFLYFRKMLYLYQQQQRHTQLVVSLKNTNHKEGHIGQPGDRLGMDIQGTTEDTNHLEGELAFKSLFDAHYQRLVLFADSFIWNTAAAEDIVQAVFTDLWQRGTLKDLGPAARSYLYTAVKNRCLNEIRNQNVRDSHNLRYVQAMLNVWEDGEDSSALLEELRNCIRSLPEQVRRTIELRYFHGKSVSETAEILNVSENTVKTQIKRGRASLKLSLSEVHPKLFLILVTLLTE